MSCLEALSFHPMIEKELPGEAGRDIRGQISLTFIHDDPDLKRDVPTFG